MPAELPPERPPIPTPPRPDVPGSWTPVPAGGLSVAGAPADAAPARRRPASRVVAFVAVLALTIATLGGGLLAIERLTRPQSDASQHDFLAFRIDGSPLRWNPCDTIHYVINPSRAPEGSVEDVHEAVRQVSRATGIAFAYDGLTDEVPTRRRQSVQRDRYGERWAPVLIAWVDPDETDIDFERDTHEAAAVAAPARPLTGEELLVTGFVAMNLEDPNPPGFGWPGAQGPVLLHELGHVMGLAHIDTPGEIMEKAGGGVTGFGPGDLEGLRRLGREAGCLTTPEPL
ncbi:MAG TPA: hypothetical protein VLA82_04980 [Actinomycetota bacterium]|nr:hypothetical protein [Actinomycetota bacterium]